MLCNSCAGLHCTGPSSQHWRQQLRCRTPQGGMTAFYELAFILNQSQAMKEYATVMPAVNQIELSPWRACAAIVTLCKSMGVMLQASAVIALVYIIRLWCIQHHHHHLHHHPHAASAIAGIFPPHQGAKTRRQTPGHHRSQV
jgi:hypothetical protein